MLHLCISGALYRPLHVHVLITRNERLKKQKEEEKAAELSELSKPVVTQPPEPPQLQYNYSHPHFGHHQHLHYHQPLVNKINTSPTEHSRTSKRTQPSM